MHGVTSHVIQSARVSASVLPPDHQRTSPNLTLSDGKQPSLNVTNLLCRFCLEESPGVQRVYGRPSTPPPTKVTCLSDKEQKEWVKDVQGIIEQ